MADDGALRHQPPGNPVFSHHRAPISRSQTEALLSRAVAGFGLLFAIQSVPVMIAQLWEVNVWWAALFLPIFYGSILVATVAAILRWRVRLTQGIVALCYLAGIATWPLAITAVESGTHSIYWLYYLLTAAAAMAAIAFSPLIAASYLLVVSTLLAAVRAASGAVVGREAVLDSIYAVIFGGAIIVIIAMLRQAATTVDAAQATALDAYALAVRQHATEVERAQVDAIVHDSVLTTLLSAARAETPEARRLAATMAGNAIGHLRSAALVGPHDGATLPLATVSSRISDAARSSAVPFEVRTRGIGLRSIPVAAAEAVIAAAVQAMVNSAQHAGESPRVKRWVTVRGLLPFGIVVEVGDTGAGFAAWSIPAERLGVRVSIVERLANAGGRAEIDSAPGEGTVVTIRWPAEGR